MYDPKRNEPEGRQEQKPEEDQGCVAQSPEGVEGAGKKVNAFTEDYFMRGPETGLSNYRDYSWKPDLTVPACKKIAEYLGMRRGDSVLDVGCSRGYYVRAMRMLGYRAFGYDISEWAIQNCDREVAEYVGNEFPKRAFDWVTMKDVAEHIQLHGLATLVETLNQCVTKGMLIIVPLAFERGGPYIRNEDEMDRTHVIRWTMDDWIAFLEDHADGFNVNASYNIHGIKPAAAKVRHSTGFFTLVRP